MLHQNHAFHFQTSQKGTGYRKWHRLYPEFHGRHQCKMLQATGGGLDLWPQEPGAETLPGQTVTAAPICTTWGWRFIHSCFIFYCLMQKEISPASLFPIRDLEEHDDDLFGSFFYVCINQCLYVTGDSPLRTVDLLQLHLEDGTETPCLPLCSVLLSRSVHCLCSSCILSMLWDVTVWV